MLDATGHYWVASLAYYNFRFHYKSRKSNVETDALSRLPWDMIINQETVKSLMENAVTKPNVTVEACAGRAVTINKSASVFPIPRISRQKWERAIQLFR